MLFGAATLTTKLSVLFFYSRVFTSRSMRIATMVTLVLVVLWGIGNLLQTFLVCHIIDGTWYDFFGLALPCFVQPLVAMRPSILQARKALCCPDSLERPLPPASTARPKKALADKHKFERQISTNHTGRHATNPNFCGDLQASFISIGLFNLITNTIIMLVPLYTIWTLQKVSVSTRLGLSAVFLLNLM